MDETGVGVINGFVDITWDEVSFGDGIKIHGGLGNLLEKPEFEPDDGSQREDITFGFKVGIGNGVVSLIGGRSGDDGGTLETGKVVDAGTTNDSLSKRFITSVFKPEVELEVDFNTGTWYGKCKLSAGFLIRGETGPHGKFDGTLDESDFEPDDDKQGENAVYGFETVAKIGVDITEEEGIEDGVSGIWECVEVVDVEAYARRLYK